MLCIFHKSTISLDGKFMVQEPVCGPAISMDFGVNTGLEAILYPQIFNAA
jgi:hypothetical protein